MKTTVQRDAHDQEWLVWAHLPDEDPTALRANSLVIGTGATRDAAVADAVNSLEAALNALQQPA